MPTSNKNRHGLPKGHEPHPLDSLLVSSFDRMEAPVRKVFQDDSDGYQLVIRIPISAVDDVMARTVAKNILLLLGSDKNVKLQRVFKSKQPESVPL